MRRDSRADANQAEIVAALRAVGASVQHLHMVGGGCPDLLVGFQGNHLLEVKIVGGKLSEKQVEWHRIWRGYPVYVIETIEEALTAIGVEDE